MKNDFTKNYFNIYLWRLISLFSNFLSFLLVIPSISNDVELFGIYSFCLSFSIYLSYSDLGFLNAGWKYASKALFENKNDFEAEILGFTIFILILMCIPFSIGIFFAYLNPSILFNNLALEHQNIASGLFLIMAFLLPLQVIFQRIVQSILVIRIKDYIYLRVDVLFNFVKILSIFYFFTEEDSLFVQYYLFITLISIISSIFILIYVIKNEKFNFSRFFTNIKFSRLHYNITKKLAFSSLFATIAWVIYYELDLIIIGSFFDSYSIGIYAVGFSFLGFLKNLWSIVFSPYSQRFNHFSDEKSIESLKLLANNLIIYTFPLMIIVSTILIIFAEKLIILWVGNTYQESVNVIIVLIISTIFGFITQPASFYYTSKNKYNYIYFNSAVLPIVFILGLYMLIPIHDILGVAISKVLATFGSFLISLYALRNIINIYLIFKKWILQLLIFIIISFFFLPELVEVIFYIDDKSSINLIFLCFLILILICFSFIFVILTDKKSRNYLIKTYNKNISNN